MLLLTAERQLWRYGTTVNVIGYDTKALVVDHIVPSNHGGSDELSNLQASYVLREADCVICVLKLITGRMARPENELRSDPDLQSPGDCFWKESTVIGCDPMR